MDLFFRSKDEIWSLKPVAMECWLRSVEIAVRQKQGHLPAVATRDTAECFCVRGLDTGAEAKHKVSGAMDSGSDNEDRIW